MSAITWPAYQLWTPKRVLAQVWLPLEKHHVASPGMAVKSLRNIFKFGFALKEDADSRQV
jgi:hypothetical protein